MLSDADIQKLKAVFATKNDLRDLETRIKKDISHEMETKLQTMKKEIVKDVAYTIQAGVMPILNEHEKRIDRLEKHVGGFPSIA